MNDQIGDLVYIPSYTNLVKYGKSSPTKVHQLITPQNLLVLEEEEKKFGVLFEGEVWYVIKKDVYNVKSR